MTAPTRLIAAPWVTIADLPESRPAIDDDTWTDLCWQASELLYLWSGKQFPGEATSTVVLETSPGASGHSFCWRDWDEPWVPRGVRGIRDAVVARLPDAPVKSISQLTIDDTALTVDVDYFAELPAGLIWRTNHLAWPTDGTTRVTYTHGMAPPIGGKRAATLLALELGRSWTGAKCNLPRRIESVTREGISINLAVALQGWRTGIWDIDAWLHSVNPNMMSRRARAWSPDVTHARRTIT